MSVSKPSERSPLLGQTTVAQNVPANGKYGEDDKGEDFSTRHEQPSNARLALIMGSIWVRSAGNHYWDFEADFFRLV